MTIRATVDDLIPQARAAIVSADSRYLLFGADPRTYWYVGVNEDGTTYLTVDTGEN